MSEEIFKEEKIITQHDVENRQLRVEENEKLRKEENEKLRKEKNKKLRKENEQLRKNNIVIDATIKEPIEIKSFKEYKNMADNYLNWFDRNKFEKILAIIDSNKFNYKNKIGKLKYINIKDLVNNIRNNKTSKISAKIGLNTLNEIKNAEIIQYKQRTPKHKDLLNLLNNLLDTNFTDKTLMSSKDEDEKENKIKKKMKKKRKRKRKRKLKRK